MCRHLNDDRRAEPRAADELDRPAQRVSSFFHADETEPLALAPDGVRVEPFPIIGDCQHDTARRSSGRKL